MTLASSEKKEREERFQNYIKAGSGKYLKRKQRRRFQVLCPETGRYLKVPQKHLLKEALPWKKMTSFFERMIDGGSG